MHFKTIRRHPTTGVAINAGIVDIKVILCIYKGERLIEDAHEEAVNPAGIIRIAASPEFGGLLVKISCHLC